MADLPVGTVTFLFTDIEGSTRLLQALGERFPAVLEQHHAILREAISAHHGTAVATEGDAFFAVFPSASDAVAATVAAQHALANATWPDNTSIRVRMGLHTGNGELGGDNYVGLDVHRAARIAAAGHGGQVVVSDATRALAEPALPEGIGLRDLGHHRLKDLQSAEHLFQLVIAGLPSDFPALRSLETTPTNLVAPLTPLVGRDRELTDLAKLLETSRLLTLTGPGGTGKTRLATELGRRSLAEFSDGAFFVALETLTERALVATAIGQTLGAHATAQQDPEQVLIDHLGHRQLLLILDNFEQVVVASPLVARLMTSGDGLNMVVTSRVPLHVSGEQEYPVPPLEIPQSTDGDLDALSRVEAVELFVDRARRAQPSFSLTDANAAPVVAICRRLDGLPLAIELAAARIKLLPPDAILARLEQALPMLAGGTVDQPARQRTLRGAIEWSYRLLSEEQQTLYRRLTVFSGGWTIEAAEQVAGGDGEADVDVFDGISTLLDQSLVRAAANAPVDEPRFEMLLLIREYGAERLAESPEADAIARRHAAWVLALAEAAEPSLESADVAWLDRLSREHDNVRAALRWLTDHDERETALRLASAIWRFWQLRGLLPEGRAWFRRLMPAQADDPSVDPGVLAAAHTAAGGLAYWQNDMDDALAHYRAAEDLDRQHDRSDRLGDDVYNVAFISLAESDLPTARELMQEASELFAAAKQMDRLADTTAALGALEMRAGNLELARDLLAEGRRGHLAQGNHRRATDNALVLSLVEFRLGDYQSARSTIVTVLDESNAVGDVSRWPLILDVAMLLALAAGRPRDAVRLAGASAAHRAKMGGGAPSFVVADHAAHLVEAREKLAQAEGPDAPDAAFAEGEALDNAAMDALVREATVQLAG